MVRPDERAAIDRLCAGGWVAIVERSDSTVWAQATRKGLNFRNPMAEHRNMNTTMGGFFGKGGANVRTATDDTE